MKNLFFILFMVSSSGALAQDNLNFTIEDDFPGGNIVIDTIKGDTVFLHQDLHDTEGNWFYWNFRVKGAAGRKLTFQFTHPWGNDVSKLNVIGVNGPGVSLNKGKNWEWLGMDQVKGNSFRYSFDENSNNVQFSFAMPYTSVQFSKFMKPYEEHPNIEIGDLAITRSGRNVERLHLGKIHGKAKYKVAITARHHACEMMTNYALEGLIKFVLENDKEGKWLRKNVEILIVPFVDKDGVEEGDQGKNRRPRDHNRDYSGESIYASTAALRKYIPVWSKGKLIAAIDLHCPYIRGKQHQVIHQVGHSDKNIWEEQKTFAAMLQMRTSNSSLPYYSSNDIPYGTSWNTGGNYTSGKSFSSWAAELNGVKLTTTIEIPYADVSGNMVTQNNTRALGVDLGQTLYDYLKNEQAKDNQLLEEE